MSKLQKVLIVGGDPIIGKPSGVVSKLSIELTKIGAFMQVINGIKWGKGGFTRDISDADLTIWMPSISNDVPKVYPKKKQGTVLICSKFMHDNVTKADAVTRIFKMNGNAVLCVYTPSNEYPLRFRFELIDALGNSWSDISSDLHYIASCITKFYGWSSNQKRVSIEAPLMPPTKFLDLNRELATKVQGSIGSRFFGNSSTRCMRLFPSMKAPEGIFLFSARNTNKEHLAADDFVTIKCLGDGKYVNLGQKKQSIDTPIQLAIYNHRQNINYLVHGHAFIKGAPTTEEYFPCGDMRELNGVLQLIDVGRNQVVINLKQHGFLIGATTLPHLENVIKTAKIEPLNILT